MICGTINMILFNRSASELLEFHCCCGARDFVGLYRIFMAVQFVAQLEAMVNAAFYLSLWPLLPENVQFAAVFCFAFSALSWLLTIWCSFHVSITFHRDWSQLLFLHSYVDDLAAAEALGLLPERGSQDAGALMLGGRRAGSSEPSAGGLSEPSAAGHGAARTPDDTAPWYPVAEALHGSAPVQGHVVESSFGDATQTRRPRVHFATMQPVAF